MWGGKSSLDVEREYVTYHLGVAFTKQTTHVTPPVTAPEYALSEASGLSAPGWVS